MLNFQKIELKDIGTLNKLWNANNFLTTNKCNFAKTDKIPKTTLNINKWIYSELIEIKTKLNKY